MNTVPKKTSASTVPLNLNSTDFRLHPLEEGSNVQWTSKVGAVETQHNGVVETVLDGDQTLWVCPVCHQRLKDRRTLHNHLQSAHVFGLGLQRRVAPARTGFTNLNKSSKISTASGVRSKTRDFEKNNKPHTSDSSSLDDEQHSDDLLGEDTARPESDEAFSDTGYGEEWREKLRLLGLRVIAVDDFALLICQTCGWALEPKPSYVSKHLGKNTAGREHSHIPKGRNRGISEKTIRQTLEPVAKKLIGFEQFMERHPSKSSIIPAIDGIAIHDGYYQPSTNTFAGSYTQFTSSEKRFQKLIVESQIKRCKLQRVFCQQNLWRVDVSPDEDDEERSPPNAQAALAQLLQGIRMSAGSNAWDFPNNPHATLGDTHPFYRENGWQRWHEELAPEVESALKDATAFRPSSNQMHKMVFDAVRDYMDYSLQTCGPDNRIMREKVNQSRSNKDKRVKPFARLATAYSCQVYARVLATIVLLTMHVALNEAEDDDNNKKPFPLSLSATQTRSALQLWDFLQEKAVSNEEDDEGEPDDDDNEDGIFVPAEEDDDEDDDEEGDSHLLDDEHPQYRDPSIEPQGMQQVPNETIQLVHNLAMALFAIETPGSETSHPAAVLAMFWSKTTGGAMRPAREISSFLVKVQYAIRLTIYTEAIWSSQKDGSDPETALSPLQSWVQEKERTIFRWIRHAISSAAKACIQDQRLPNIMPLDPAGTAWSYQGQVISVEQYRKYSMSLSQECMDTLCDVLEGMEWDDILERFKKRPDGWGLQDDVSCEDNGYSVFEDPDNGVQDLWEVIVDRMVQTGRYHYWDTSNKAGHQRFSWNIPAVTKWILLVDQLCRILHLACFESFAAPPRAPEFASILIRNIPGRVRSIFKINDLTTIIIRYNKTSTQTGFDNPIARSIPYSLQKILDIYIVLKRVVWFFKEHALKTQSGHADVHLWALHNGHVLDSDDLTKIQRQRVEPYMGKGVARVYGIRCNRHFKKAVGRRSIENHPVTKAMDESSLSLFERQGGHSQAIADMFYARIGGRSFHPTISPRILRNHQILGQIMHGVFGYNPPPGGNLQLELPQPPEWMFQPCEGSYEPKRSWEGGPQDVDERSLGVASEETTSQGLASEPLDGTQDIPNNETQDIPNNETQDIPNNDSEAPSLFVETYNHAPHNSAAALPQQPVRNKDGRFAGKQLQDPSTQRNLHTGGLRPRRADGCFTSSRQSAAIELGGGSGSSKVDGSRAMSESHDYDEPTI